MLISCPNCKFSRDVDDSKVPEWAGGVKCTQCGHKILLDSGKPLEWLPKETAVHDSSSSSEELVVTPTDDPSKEITDVSTPAEEVKTPETKTDSTIPWESGPEQPKKTSWRTRAFWKTVKMVLFKPSVFYEKMPLSGGYKQPMHFNLYLGIMCGVYISCSTRLFITTGTAFFKESTARLLALLNMDPPSEMFKAVLMAGLLFIPMLLPLFLFVHAGLIHLFLTMAKDENLHFETTYHIASYGSAVSVFTLIPGIGPVVALFWHFVTMTIGLSRVYKIKSGEAFWFAISPFIVYAGAVPLIIMIGVNL